MKTLATCSPVEFLVQTNKIRRSVESWLTMTKVMEIRKRLPELPQGAKPEDVKKARQEQAKKNFSSILDSVLEEHPQETAELLGMLCFIEPEDLGNHSMLEIISSVNELIASPEVLSFFTSLMQLVQTVTSDTAKG